MDAKVIFFGFALPVLVATLSTWNRNPSSNDILTFEQATDGFGDWQSRASQTPKLRQFHWSSCSGPNSLLRIKRLEVSDPIAIPGNLTVAVDSFLAGDIGAPLKVAIDVQKKLGPVWINVPCIDEFGSCNYVDMCPMIPFPPDQPCPMEPFQRLGLPCHCPVSKGIYQIKKLEIPIPEDPLPEFLARGTYNVKVQASSNGIEVACLKINFSLA